MRRPSFPHTQGAASRAFDRFASKTSQLTGSGAAFAIAFLIIIVWMVTGPVFGFTDTWQLVINTGTTIITFLMVFLIQHAQNKDSRVVQIKLNEIIAAVEGASNRLIDIEELTEDEIKSIHKRFQRLAHDAEKLGAGARTTVEEEP